MAGLEIVTFGCRLNSFESEIIRRSAGSAGLDDAVIVNTCAVTAEAERQARQAIRRARRERPGARLIVTGCAAQIHPELYAAMPEVDEVIGNQEKLEAASYGGTAATLPDAAPDLVDGFEGRARGSVVVQQGCDHHCTFCIIPLGRGANRSVPIGEIVRQVRGLVASGHREVVLTGVDIASFGHDLPGEPSLGQLCRRLLALVPDLPRLRLSSLDPAAIDEDLWRLVAEEPRLMPHLHLSLQAADDLILKRMRRRHSRGQALAACRRARDLRPGIALGADLIAGFPTEDAAMFENTRRFVGEAGLDYLHVFPFSARAETPASRMPPVPAPQVRERARILRDEAAAALQRSLGPQVGTTVSIVVERGQHGHSEHYAPVRFTGSATVGTIARIALSGMTKDALVGTVT